MNPVTDLINYFNSKANYLIDYTLFKNVNYFVIKLKDLILKRYSAFRNSS